MITGIIILLPKKGIRRLLFLGIANIASLRFGKVEVGRVSYGQMNTKSRENTECPPRGGAGARVGIGMILVVGTPLIENKIKFKCLSSFS